MCILDGWLYINDNSRLLRCKMDAPNTTLETISIRKGTKYNDAATDGRYVWISDTADGVIVRYAPQTKTHIVLQAPKTVNGVACRNGRLLAVSWGEHDLYEIDLNGKTPPRAFGLADKFTNLDGIEILDDGTLIVSDFKGNKVCTVSSDGKTVRTMIEIESPADIGIDGKRNLLYVPQFMKDKIAVFRLEKRR